MNHDEILDNRANLLSDSNPKTDCDELIFAMRDYYHVFSLDLSTVLQCLYMAEQESAIPELPDDWWITIAKRYKISLL